MSIDPQTFAKRRMSLGFTQKELSEGICTPSMISQFESGKAFLSTDKLLLIAQRLGITIEVTSQEVAKNAKNIPREQLNQILRTIQELADAQPSTEAFGAAVAEVLKDNELITSIQYEALKTPLTEPESATVA